VSDRTLRRGDRGADVALLQRDVNRWLGRWRIPEINEDGELDAVTWAWFRRVAYALGLSAARFDRGATPEMRRMIRDPPGLRTRAELAAARKRRPWLRRLKRRYARRRFRPPRPDLRTNVRNQSSRGGARPRLIVIHTTESVNRRGVTDIRGIVAWFNSSRSQASSHVVNDGEGRDARLVPDSRKAWTQGAFNAVALSIEQVGRASTSRSTWLRSYRRQLDNTALWIAYWSRTHGIPVRRGATRGCGVVRSGVVSHNQLGCGNTHTDPGPGYPWDYVLRRARELAG
jgi:hypothetical protein